jgi:uncharacterized cupin superfamily protein
LVKESDYCYFPAGRAGHHLFNHTHAVWTFFTLGENKPDEVCYFPKSGKVRIMQHRRRRFEPVHLVRFQASTPE